MQLPGGPGPTPPPPPPLAPLWERVVRAGALPPDLDVDRLYVAIRDRLRHPESEVRLHALRVLADALPIAGRALTFPFDEAVDNLGHGSPNVRKAALDALKVFCMHCEEPECAARALLDECLYRGGTGSRSRDIDARSNVITGLVLSIPSLLNILKRRDSSFTVLPIFRVLGDMLFDPVHRDIALRSLVKLRRVCGPREYMDMFSRLEPHVQHKFRTLYEMHDEDSIDVYYARKKTALRDDERNGLVTASQVSEEENPFHGSTSADSSSEDSYVLKRDDSTLCNGFAKVIIETEIKFDADTAITMTVLEENETEVDSEQTGTSEDDRSFGRDAPKYSDGESEDTDVVVSQKRVRFGGESVKIRTPDSDNLLNSDDDKATGASASSGASAPHDVSHHADKEEAIQQVETKSEQDKDVTVPKPKKSGIPLPIIHTKRGQTAIVKSRKDAKQKSKSLSELYDYFKNRNDVLQNKPKGFGFALTLSEVRSPEKIPSPVPEHKEVEVLHNLQRSPVCSPKRHTTLQLEHDGFVLNVLTMSPHEDSILSPRPATPLLAHYDWETVDILPGHVVQQLHNTENWIAVVRAADQLHSALLKPENVVKVEPAALSLVRHMWALSETVPAARAPAEGAVCALVRSSSSECARRLLPALVSRLTRTPPPTALPHALLQRLPLHHLIELLFDPDMTNLCGEASRVQSGQLRAALCVARAAGPAAVMAAVRRRLAGTARAQIFCQKLRERLSRPIEKGNARFTQITRSSQLPVAVRRRARSTPPPAPPLPPRRLRPLPDSAPLPGLSHFTKELLPKPIFPIPLCDRNSSAFSAHEERPNEKEYDKAEEVENYEKKNTADPSPVDDVAEVHGGGEETPEAPRSPSVLVEDCFERSPVRDHSVASASPQRSERFVDVDSLFGSTKSLRNEVTAPPPPLPIDRKLSPSPVDRRSTPSPTDRKSTPSILSRRSLPGSPLEESGSRTPSPNPSLRSDGHEASPTRCESVSPCSRDVRTALAECIVPARHEDWETIVTGLAEAARLAADTSASAPPAAWRAVARATAAHVRSLRSRVARAACAALGVLYERRGRILDLELEESASALLDRCADVNRFLRADASSALIRVACAGSSARATVALCRRGAAHRAGPARAAAAQALVELVRVSGAARILDLPPEPRTVLLRAAAELLGDATPEARAHARRLCLALAEDHRFRPLLKESMPPARYRAVEKNVDKLRCR